jgi:hypothetical protein
MTAESLKCPKVNGKYRACPGFRISKHPPRIVGQNALPAIPPLRYVVSQIGYNHPSDSRYGPPQYQKTS